ncbi:MAG: flavin reductase family protein [Tateyamaria sp.]|jgi:flavin reductase (DIM6/NTAB) family NADH-FMN oxidoreductase RutF|nr:flavin reductase family protein [Tateyamaria sp.]
MFYRPCDGHNLPHNPFNAIITPRPIGWISTRNMNGNDNLAPYSFFNGIAYVPPQVMFASTGTKDDQDGTKDSVANIRETGEFCVNIVEHSMKDVMNQTSGLWDADTDEFNLAKIEKANCKEIDCARVATAPASLECKTTQIVKIEGRSNYVVFGEVVGVYIRDDCIVDGIFDVLRYHPLTRLGYRDYSVIREKFSLNRPNE